MTLMPSYTKLVSPFRDRHSCVGRFSISRSTNCVSFFFCYNQPLPAAVNPLNDGHAILLPVQRISNP